MSRILIAGLILALLVWFFAGVLFFDHLFAFRDAAHYYYPLFQFIQSQWTAGNVPLWNPLENLGVPLAADATASVFYPGKAIFLLPLGYDWCFRLYVIGHVLLAAAAAFWTARRWGGSREAAGIAAISYAFSGSVLFQYCNVVYLVGAAWLPLALPATEKLLAGRSFRAAVALGAVLAMMVLGGDPQAAYHAGLLAVFFALLLAWDSRRGGRLATKPAAGRSHPVLLAAAAAIALGLAAIQWLPAAEYSRQSPRADSEVARSLYEIPRQLLRGGPKSPHWADGLLCRDLNPLAHHEHVYHFSVGPWRLPELVWPNFGGRQFPAHRRWLDAIPAEGRVWVPSLYMGLLPLVLAVWAMRLGRGDVRERWLSWAAVFALVASLGWYGLGWIFEEIRNAAGRDPAAHGPVGAPFGGLYWLMTVVLPGYIYFRYPAKLLVVTTLALSLLAARAWDQAFAERPAALRRGWVWLGGVSLVLAAAVTAVRPFWAGWFAGVEPNVLFGPLDAAGAVNDLTAGLLQTAVLSGLFWAMLSLRFAAWVQPLALAVTAVDLALANGWIVATAPARLWHEEPQLATVLNGREATRGDDQPYRIWRAPIWMPPSWEKSSSAERLAEAVRWDRDTLFPKYNLPAGAGIAEVHGALMPDDYRAFLILARLHEEQGHGPPPALAKYALGPEALKPPGAHPVDLADARTPPQNVALWSLPNPLPRAWIVHRVEVLWEPSQSGPEEIRKRTQDIFWPNGRPRDLRRSAVVEIPDRVSHAPAALPAVAADPLTGARGREEPCRIAEYGPSHVEIEARLERPGLVILADQYFPGWTLEVTTAGKGTRQATVLRTNRIMRGAWLEAGHHRLVYRYRPASFFWGAMISGLAWMGLATGTVIWLRRPSV